MNEEFDDRLKNLIADVFDNYEDNSANEGWALLREKYPEKEKRRGIIWLWWGSAAAVLLMVLSLGIWLSIKPIVNTTAQHPVPAVQKPGNPAINPVKDSIAPAKNSTINTGEQIATNPSVKIPAKTNGAIIAAATSATTHKGTGTHPAKVSGITQQLTAKNAQGLHRARPNNLHPDQGEQPINTPVNTNTGDQKPVVATNHTATQPIVKITDSAVLATNRPEKTDTAKNLKPAIKQPAHPVFTAAKPNDVQIAKKADNKVKFGVYAATYFNYAKGSDNQFNVGAGLLAEIKLSGRFKLLTGLAVNQNSLNYQSAIPQTANTYLTYSIANQPNDQPFAATAGSGTAGGSITGSITGSNSIAAPTTLALQNYKASLFGLDVPVNLKYSFDKNDNYISAGISSGTYINETYQFTYNYSSPSYTTANKNVKTQNAFNTFDFARTLNLSFGVGYPLGKKNKLVIEPFVKYPLSGLGSQDLKFGAGGVNLKLNFLPSTK